MSKSVSIDIRLFENNNRKTIEIIQELESFGWTLLKEGDICYLPLGDNDQFDWREEKIDTQTLIDLLDKKEKAKEIIGITMTWEKTDIGGTFLFWPKEKLNTFSMNIDINRKTKSLDEHYKITDFEWYLSKLLPPLNKCWGVEYFAFDEHI